VIPTDVENVVIRVGETIVFQIRDGSIVVPATAGAAGEYVVEFAALSP
jgi:hypothetical protein